MSIEKMRADFEGYIKDRGHAIDWSSERGVYVDYVVQVAWRCWQVARAELVIELPRLPNLDDFNDIGQCAASRKMHYACRRAIEAAGVRVKP